MAWLWHGYGMAYEWCGDTLKHIGTRECLTYYIVRMIIGNRDYFISNAMKYRKPNSHERTELSSAKPTKVIFEEAGRYTSR